MKEVSFSPLSPLQANGYVALSSGFDVQVRISPALELSGGACTPDAPLLRAPPINHLLRLRYTVLDPSGRINPLATANFDRYSRACTTRCMAIFNGRRGRIFYSNWRERVRARMFNYTEWFVWYVLGWYAWRGRFLVYESSRVLCSNFV